MLTSQLKCKYCDFKSKDAANAGGHLTTHLRVEHGFHDSGRGFLWGDHFDIVVINQDSFDCPYCDWKSIDVFNKSGAISTHLKTAHNLEPWDFCEKYPEYKDLWIEAWKRKELIDIINSGEDSYLVCLECDTKMKKITQTHLDKHGMTPAQYRLKYGVENLSSNRTRGILRDNFYQNTALIEQSYESKGEREIKMFLTDCGIEYISPRRVDHVEIDIYVPKYKIGIEYNGLYFHGEFNFNRDSRYHINKTKYMESGGMQLLHIFEDEWLYKKEIVKSRLLAKFGKSDYKLDARKCSVEFIETNESREFFEKNHIQGPVNGVVHLGLRYRGELVSAMIFSKPRRIMGKRNISIGEYELSRFASKLYTNVRGAANKLLAHFENIYEPIKITSYADRRYSTTIRETLYDNLGFVKIGNTRPNYWYMRRHVAREYRFNYTKHKILARWPDSDPNMSEVEIMKSRGYDRIWDCGSIRYEKLYNTA